MDTIKSHSAQSMSKPRKKQLLHRKNALKRNNHDVMFNINSVHTLFSLGHVVYDSDSTHVSRHDSHDHCHQILSSSVLEWSRIHINALCGFDPTISGAQIREQTVQISLWRLMEKLIVCILSGNIGLKNPYFIYWAQLLCCKHCCLTSSCVGELSFIFEL